MHRPAVSTWQLRGARLPVLVSIPHAGRDLPHFVKQEARVPVAELQRLSDPWCDLIAAPLFAAGARVVKANALRAVADCNRHEGDMDGVDVAVGLRPRFAPPGRKARAGLGVIPARLPGCGPLWRAPIGAPSFEQRLNHAHRPYHCAMAEARDAMLREFGRLLIIDLHSMPSLTTGLGAGPASQIVIGNRHGRSADNRLAAMIAACAAERQFTASLNSPYAGGHIADLYGKPRDGVHVVQVEFDRALYLDSDRRPDAGRALMLGDWLLQAVMCSLPIIETDDGWPLAAE
jgi:N-formylglutamate amidohydrolase